MTVVLAFWASIALIVYGYIGFPLLVAARAATRPRPWVARGAGRPSVTVVIAAHNEQDAIAAKVRNVLTLDYPAELLDCVIVSDGSTDATVSEAEGAAGGRLVVIDLPRSGKAVALNHGIENATGDVVVFTDANSRLAADAVARIVEPFADPEVGGVAGDQRYLAGDEAGGERAYWSFDRMIKQAESRGGNVISATGALYAVRRELARPVPDGVTDDFAMSTGVIELGHRLVFEPGAIAYEPPAPELRGEYRRKVRVMTRGFRSVGLRRALLDPRRSGFYAVQLFSHKLLRRLVVIPMVVAAWTGWRLRRRRPIYRLAAAGQLTFHGLGILGLALSRHRFGRSKLLAIPAYFAMINAAALHAVWNLLTGKRIDRWTPQRDPVEAKR